jgi:homoserine kinase type II
MGSYTTVDMALAQEIIGHYELGEVEHLQALSLGISNSNYKICISSINYLLKVSNDKNKHQLNQEMAILNALGEKSFPFSLVPIKTKSDQFTYQVESHFGVLFPFVEGIPPGPSDQTCFAIGQGLAQLHNLEWSSEQQQKIRAYSQVGEDLHQIKLFTEDKNCPEDFKHIYELLLSESYDIWSNANHRKGLVHGDLYYDNTLFDQNKLSAILDFEQSGYGNVLLDLGISISGTCLEKGRIIRPLITSFLKGYNKERSLSQSENDLLNLAIIIGLFSISLWRIKRFTTGKLDPSMRDSYKSLLYKAKVFNNLNGHQHE